MRKLVFLLVVLIGLVFTSSAMAAQEHLVKKGECLSLIGQKAKISWREIAKINKLEKPYIIYVGQKLRLPNLREKKVSDCGRYNGVLRKETLVQLGFNPQLAENFFQQINSQTNYQFYHIPTGFHPALTTCGNHGTVNTFVNDRLQKVMAWRIGCQEVLYLIGDSRWARRILPKDPPVQKKRLIAKQPAPKPVLTPLSNKDKLNRFSLEESDTLGNRVDTLFKWTRRGRLTGNAHQRVDVFYTDIAIYPIRWNDYYFGLDYTFLGVEGITHKGYPFDVSFHLLGPAFKWFPKDEGHELGLSLGFGTRYGSGGSHSAWMLGVYYTNTQRKIQGHHSFSEYTVWGSFLSSSTDSWTLGGRLYLYDFEDWRIFAEGKIGFEGDYKLVSAGIGITDRRNIIEFGAGLEVGTYGLSYYFGPAVKPDNLVNHVELQPITKVIQITDQGIVPIIKKNQALYQCGPDDECRVE